MGVVYAFLCPSCGEITDTMKEVWKEYQRYIVVPSKKGTGIWKYEACLGGDILYVSHDCGFADEKCTAEAFIIRIKNGIIEPHGDYWHYNPDEFKKLAEKLKGRIVEVNGKKLIIKDYRVN